MASDAVLRIASHNVRGLTKAKAGVLVQAWQRNKLDLVLLQETHVNNPHDRAAIEASLSAYKIVWSFPLGSSYSSVAPSADGPSAPVRACRGVALCVRRAALAPRGPIAWEDASVVPGNEGRSIAVTIRWAGHTIRLVNVYLPNIPAERQRFITSCVLPLVTSLPNGAQLILGGDFNFVIDPEMDRLRLPDVRACRPADPTVAHWTASMPWLTDVFRTRHPHRREFTWFRPAGGHTGAHSASRIDRFYVTPHLAGYVRSMRRCSEATARSPVFRLIADADHISDHAMIGVALTAKAPVRQGRSGMGRVRLRFEGHQDLVREFERRAGLLIGTLPAGGVRLIEAWPRFKKSLAFLVRDINSRVHHPSSSERAALSSRFSGVIARCQNGDALALNELPLARRLLVEADQADSRNATTIERREWLHHGESPGPLLSSQLKRPPGVDSVAALRIAHQPLVTDPLLLPDVMACHLESISSRQPVDMTAQTEVLGSVEPTRRLSQAQASLLEDVDVSDEEVLASLKRASPGTSPGPDGLPMDLWRKYRALFAPPLARLFSAIAAGGRLPTGFHTGNITMIFKAGDRTDPANYRPITLLNSDYRAYARVLASRLGPILSSVIDPHQTAFLPGRHIGENILLAQALPRALSRANAGAVSVACDFRKAYDTVDREYLYQAMRVMGCGPQFCRMVKALLTRTRARVELNGFQSRSVAFAIGVRQGCPLAPFLYLFVAQTMSCFLTARGIGIVVAGTRLVVTQFADDTFAYLPSWDRVAPFLQDMTQFGRASGQYLNLSKTTAIPMGTLAVVPPPLDVTLRVATKPVMLGVPLSEDLSSGIQSAKVDWGRRTQRVLQRLQKISTLPISAFGRGLAASSYALSSLLYVAEFAGFPTLPAARGRLVDGIAPLQAQVANLVDTGRGPLQPNATERVFRGVSLDNQFGSPRLGGFGVLPLRHHILARHAVWAVRLLVALTSQRVPLWARILKAEIDGLHRGTLLMRRSSITLGIVNIFLYRPSLAEMASASPPVRRMFQALAAMPCPFFHTGAQLRPGSLADMQSQLMSVWGWPTTTGFVSIRQLTVRAATELLVAEQLAARQEKHKVFCRQACSLADAVPASDNQLEKLLRDLWQTPCGNAVKETFWRMIVDALPTAARRHASGELCACGRVMPDRAHHFWVCPVARNIVQHVQRQLDAFLTATSGPGVQLTVQHVWLCKVPPRVQPWLWRTVCMAAVSAMDFGRAFMASQRLSGRAYGQSLVDMAGTNSIARLWDLLAEVSASRRLPLPAGVYSEQPFLRFRGSWDVNRVP